MYPSRSNALTPGPRDFWYEGGNGRTGGIICSTNGGRLLADAWSRLRTAVEHAPGQSVATFDGSNVAWADMPQVGAAVSVNPLFLRALWGVLSLYRQPAATLAMVRTAANSRRVTADAMRAIILVAETVFEFEGTRVVAQGPSRGDIGEIHVPGDAVLPRFDVPVPLIDSNMLASDCSPVLEGGVRARGSRSLTGFALAVGTLTAVFGGGYYWSRS